ncbi:3-deoxy-7-phosphoheptulonate synthase [Gottschalkiaceae bacterium SANA]|nr:3-deoxy-7-phosphoheptulonate synthase [Gottschalkiaceae bacterium SANA]
MVIVMKKNATDKDIQAVVDHIHKNGNEADVSSGPNRTVIGVIGDTFKFELSEFIMDPMVDKAYRITVPYKLASRSFKEENTVVMVGNVPVGDGSFAVIAGPCAIESREQMMASAKAVKAGGANILRGGAYKPRTSPYSFQGMGVEGLKLLKEAGQMTGLPTVTELMSIADYEVVAEHADLIQIGARNMQNFALLKRVGRGNKPVLLKRGMSATLEELLVAAEYIMSEGNRNVILCERGIRTFEKYMRNTLDLNVVTAIKEMSHLPIMIDPSHASGRRNMVIPMSRASAAIKADGLMVEVHSNPDEALCDGGQSLYPEHFENLMQSVRVVHEAVRDLK